VLAHELSHVKRNDWLLQLLAETARVLFWFNPLFWLACARMRRESEFACDDAALKLGIEGPVYARHLLDLVRTVKHSGKPGTAALAMAGTSNLRKATGRYVESIDKSRRGWQRNHRRNHRADSGVDVADCRNAGTEFRPGCR
jgi:beta-lactamase regulating signal transducer with metallopeptidase domain